MFKVKFCEKATGYVINYDRTRKSIDDNSKTHYFLFESFDEAKRFCINEVSEDNSIECVIVDDNDKCVEYVSTNPKLQKFLA